MMTGFLGFLWGALPIIIIIIIIFFSFFFLSAAIVAISNLVS